jgi:hypothetical protein
MTTTAPSITPAGNAQAAPQSPQVITLALVLSIGTVLSLLASPHTRAAELPIFDAHIHYSQDAVQTIPPREAVGLLRKAGLRRAMVSSSSDDGTQLLFNEAPDLIVPSLRPYRTRSEIGTWVRDPTIITHLESRLARYRYAAIGEFHVYGADADLPVMRRVVELARDNGLLLHLHGDAEAVERVFRQDPKARILWAHGGFAAPADVKTLLGRYSALWADLAFRSDPASGGKVNPAWRDAFDAFPERFMLGTDTFAPERWWYVTEHAAWARAWLAELPPELAERIAYRNAEAMLATGPRPDAWRSASSSGAAPAAAAVAGNSPAAAASRPSCPASLAMPTADADPSAAGRLVSGLITGASVEIAWRAKPQPIAVGKPFSVEFEVCPRSGGTTIDRLQVDAWMPEHQHGMNYRPSLTGRPSTLMRADGLVFHMPGRWQLVFEMQADGRPLRLTQDLTVR